VLKPLIVLCGLPSFNINTFYFCNKDNASHNPCKLWYEV
jgi:hypothetical protein